MSFLKWVFGKSDNKEKVKIREIAIGEIKEYENNPRHNDDAVDKVAASMKEFGFKVPIVIDKNNVIVAGHTRIKAAKKLGLEKVPCIVADDLTDEQIKAFRLADNKTAEFAEWDMELLESELFGISDKFDMSAFGFDLSEFDFNEDNNKEIIEDEVPEVDEENEPITQLGQVWNLGNHYLMCGDSTSADDVSKLLSNGQGQSKKKVVDLLLTDPPYNVAYEGGTDEALTIQNDNMSKDEFVIFLKKAFACADTHLKEGGVFYVWHASRSQRQFEEAMPWEIRQQLIWNKKSLVLGRQDYQWKHEPCFYGWKDGAAHHWYNDRSQTTVMDFDKPSRNGEHPTMKPVELFAYQIKNSTKQGNIVFDPFGGSGTTIIACEQTNRFAYSMELDPKYCDVIIKRWEALTNKKAVLLNQ